MSYDRALRMMGNGEGAEVHRRTKRALVRDGLAVWTDRYEGDVELTALGKKRADELLTEAAAFLESHIIGPKLRKR